MSYTFCEGNLYKIEKKNCDKIRSNFKLSEFSAKAMYICSLKQMGKDSVAEQRKSKMFVRLPVGI